MSIATLTPHDLRVRDAVLRQLEVDANVDASAIGVTAKDGVVTLTGFVGSCGDKLAAERAARRIAGVDGVANDIQVRVRMPRTDTDIAAEAVRILDRHGARGDGVQVVVHNGRVTLTGVTPTLRHRSAVERALRRIRGQKGLINHLTIVPAPSAAARDDISSGPPRDVGQRADLGITVVVENGTVTLTGLVRSWLEREAAERAAHVPGITEVVNEIDVAPAADVSCRR
jgi:osmotically-inducible protein OsmY